MDNPAAFSHNVAMPGFDTILSLTLLLLLCGCEAERSALQYHRAPGALGPYSSSVSYDDFIFVSGKIGERGGSFEHEVETSINAVERELASSGATLDDIVQATVFLIDLDLYDTVNEIYGRRMAEPYPARACVQVSRLPGGARIEIQVIARKP